MCLHPLVLCSLDLADVGERARGEAAYRLVLVVEQLLQDDVAVGVDDPLEALEVGHHVLHASYRVVHHGERL